MDKMASIDILREIALDQHGYITTAQAEDAGVTKYTLSKLASRKRINRVAYGVYSIPYLPTDRFDNLMLAVLWTGVDNAAISHESALELYEVCDINPRTISVTVPKGVRIKRKGGEGIVLLYENLTTNKKAWRESIPTVKLSHAIKQCIEAGTATYLLEQAIEQGFQKGFLKPSEIQELIELLKVRQ